MFFLTISLTFRMEPEMQTTSSKFSFPVARKAILSKLSAANSSWFTTFNIVLWRRQESNFPSGALNSRKSLAIQTWGIRTRYGTLKTIIMNCVSKTLFKWTHLECFWYSNCSQRFEFSNMLVNTFPISSLEYSLMNNCLLNKVEIRILIRKYVAMFSSQKQFFRLRSFIADNYLSFYYLCRNNVYLQQLQRESF